MGGIDTAGQGILCHLRDLGRLRLGEPRVRGDDGERRALAALQRRLCLAGSKHLANVGERLAVRRPHAGDRLPRRRIDNRADGVDGHQRGDDKTQDEHGLQ